MQRCPYVSRAKLDLTEHQPCSPLVVFHRKLDVFMRDGMHEFHL
jgi:hypothetical protein